MKKFRIVKALAVAIILAFGAIGLVGCGKLPISFSTYWSDGSHIPLQLVMNAGETLTINETHLEGITI